MKNKKEKIKELHARFKEDWKDPRKRAGIKLSGYLVFFLIIILMGMISSAINSMRPKMSTSSTTTTTELTDKFIDKQNDLLTNKYDINYVINVNNVEYKINGNINKAIVEGYLEISDDIKKIIFKDNNFYEKKNNEEVLLELDINKNLIDVDYIINLIKQNSALIENNEIGKKYTYNINDVNIVIETDDDSIIKISILESTNKYELSFDI